MNEEQPKTELALDSEKPCCKYPDLCPDCDYYMVTVLSMVGAESI
jgi:hypothetical protein